MASRRPAQLCLPVHARAGAARDGPWNPPCPRQPVCRITEQRGLVPILSIPRAQHPSPTGQSVAPGKTAGQELSQHCRMRPHAREFCRGQGGDARAGGAFWGPSAVAWYPESLGMPRHKGSSAYGGGGAAACCTNLRPGQLLALGQGQRLSLRPPLGRAEPIPPLQAPLGLLCLFKRTPGVAAGPSSHPSWTRDRTVPDSRHQRRWHTVDRSLRRYRG